MLTTTKSSTPALRDPFQSLFQLFSDADSWFGPGRSGGQTVAPLANISETDEAYELAFELPGLQESDIQVDLHDNTLTVSAERKDTREAARGDGDTNDQPKRKWHRIEHRYGRFVRAISLPKDAASDQVDAVYENGVLTVTVPKAPEAQARRIEVRRR